MTEYFSDWQNQTATFQKLTQTFVNGELGEPAWVDIFTAPVMFYTGGTADQIVQERYRVDLAGVAILNPSDMSEAIPEDGRVQINGDYYSIIHAEDVALQGEIIQIPLKRF